MDSDAARARDLVLVALVPLFFSTNVVIGRLIAGEVGPWTLACLRWSGAFLILLPFAAGALRRHARDIVSQGPVVVLLGFLGMFICGGIVYLGLHYTTATNATLIYACSPVLILLLEWLFRGRPIGLLEISGAALAFTGVAVVALGAAGGSRFALNPGDAMIAVGALSWAIYSVLQSRPGITAIPSLPLFAAVALAGAVLLSPMMLFEAMRGPAFPQSAQIWLAVLAIALVPSVGAFFGYQYGIRRFGPATVGMLLYLQTPYGVTLALLFLGERLRFFHFIGFALIVPGVVLATIRRRVARVARQPAS
jgi:drug/metabolite transporter (DMT)-like permease